MATRRNPPSGNATFAALTVHTLSAGVLDGAADDNAEHQLHGTTRITGAADTVVLEVDERAEIQDLLTARRLNVGLTTDPDPASDDPYAAAAGDSDDPYPAIDADGDASPPERTGFTVDEGGHVRTSGFVLIKDARGGVILRAPDGTYYAFTVDAAGTISSTGRSLGTTPP